MAEQPRLGVRFAATRPPAHVRGVPEGNHAKPLDKDTGLFPEGSGAKASARRSTGINPQLADPILPESPRLPPA
jgi:hypothetical protein